MLNESNTAFIQYTVQCYLTSCPAPFFLLLFFSPTYFECIVKYSCLSANRSMTSIELGKWRKEWEMAELFDLITHLQSRPNRSLRSKREKNRTSRNGNKKKLILIRIFGFDSLTFINIHFHQTTDSSFASSQRFVFVHKTRWNEQLNRWIALHARESMFLPNSKSGQKREKQIMSLNLWVFLCNPC